MPEEIASLPTADLTLAIEAGDQSAINALAQEVHYADLAQIYQDTEEEKHGLILKSIGPEIASDVIVQLPDSMIEEALDHFSPSELKVLFRELTDDDRVDVLQDVGDEARQRYLGLLGPEDEELTRSLLRYEEDTAGGRMTTQFGRLFASMTVKEAIETLRRDQEITETLSRIFVVDSKGHLIGRVRLRDLAFNSWNTPIREIMKEVGPEQRALATTDQEEAANLLLKYDLIVLPVVDEFDHLLGIITHDDAMEILQEESTEDMEKLAGIAGETVEETYLQASVLTHFKRRFVWLFFLALLAIASGYVMMRFEGTLMKIFLLSLYLPMVVAAGGNTGGQASTMVIRAMSLGELTEGTSIRVIWKEFRLGMILGCTLGCSIAALTIFVLPAFQPELPSGVTFTRFGLTVAIALAAQITTSTVIGALLPLGARAIRLDPAVVAAPAITTVVDVSGMIIYFTIAQAILGL
ncbi:magnesium transporter [Haloferula sp.]|uniref:magnesium transporter n=1 Tax=Haloferula sp. TaxID=2497595 RepID=UPI00329E6648